MSASAPSVLGGIGAPARPTRPLLAVLALGLLASAVCAQNLLVNPQASGGHHPWRTWARKGRPEFAYDQTVGHGDSTSLRIAVREKGTDGSWLQNVACEGGVPCDYSFWFRTEPPGGTVSVLVEFSSPQGYAGQHRRELRADGAEWTRAQGVFQVPPQATSLAFEVWVNLDDVGLGTAWFDDFSLTPSTRPWVQVHVDDPLYRILPPGSGPIRFRITQSNPRAPAATYSAELRADAEVLEACSGDVGREVPAELPTTKLMDERPYTLEVRVTTGGEVMFRSEDTLVSRAQPPLVSIGPHRELRVGGRPYFPIGVYYPRLEDLQDLPHNGFNCVHAWLAPDERARAFFAEAARLGLGVVLEMSDTLRGKTDLATIRERVEAFRSEPALLCYYPVDEPHPNSTDPVGMRQAYNLIKALDPDHPVMHVQCNMGLLHTYIGASDIIAVDPYGPPELVEQWMTQATNASESRKPVWAVVGAFPWGGPDSLPTPAYLRAAVYTALIRGAKGLLYFTYYFGDHNLRTSHLWEPVGRINSEVAHLAPELLATEPMPVTSADPRVIAAAFRRDESAVLLAVNKSATEEAQVHLSLPGIQGRGERLFGGGFVECDEGVTLRLPPYGSAALRLPVAAQ